MRRTRRHFLKLAAAAGASGALRPLHAQARHPPMPYVDGLSFLSPDPADVERSGLTAFILDVSSVAPLKTTDGSVRYFRSFEACAQSMTAMRRQLLSGDIPGAFI